MMIKVIVVLLGLVALASAQWALPLAVKFVNAPSVIVTNIVNGVGSTQNGSYYYSPPTDPNGLFFTTTVLANRNAPGYDRTWWSFSNKNKNFQRWGKPSMGMCSAWPLYNVQCSTFNKVGDMQYTQQCTSFQDGQAIKVERTVSVSGQYLKAILTTIKWPNQAAPNTVAMQVVKDLAYQAPPSAWQHCTPSGNEAEMDDALSFL